MDSNKLLTPLKGLAALILLLMLVAVLYAGYMAITHWTGIGV